MHKKKEVGENDKRYDHRRDRLWLKSRREKVQIGILVCCYHDQGQIATKLKAFDTGVAGGLPYPVTTPEHGSTYDSRKRNR